MLAIRIEHIGAFMKKLLLQSAFDRFLVSEASVVTFASFSIDGQLRPEFYPEEEADAIRREGRQQARWAEIKPFCLSLIRGRQLPLSFQAVLQLPPEDLPQLLEGSGLSLAPEDIFGLFLNIQYRNETLSVTTGTSVRTFSLDHSLDNAWDQSVRELLAREELV